MRPTSLCSSACLSILLVLGAAPPSGAVEVAFAPGQSLVSLDDLQGGAYGDIDADGDLDLVAIGGLDNEVRWLENDGAGGGWASHLVIDMFDGLAVEIADLDLDGDLDIVAITFVNVGVPGLIWIENGGAGASWTTHEIDAAAQGGWLAVGDLDRDGDADVVADDTWYENPRGPGAWTSRSLPGASQIRTATVADIDEDGWPDVVTAGGDGDGTVVWWQSDAMQPPTFAKVVVASGLTSVLGAEVGDLDGDGDPDVVAAADGVPELLWLDWTGPLTTDWTPTTIDDTVTSIVRLWLADLDGDGELDVLGTDPDAGEALWWDQDAGSFTARTIADDLDATARRIFAADLDGDGDLDPYVEEVGADRLRSFENLTLHRSATFRSASAVALGGGARMDAADVDGDGDLDLLGNDLVGIRWFSNDVGSELECGLPWCVQPIADIAGVLQVDAADVDRDGDVDAVVSTLGDTLWFRNDGGFPWTQVPVGAGSNDQVLADVDGDGDLDVAIASAFGVKWFESNLGPGPLCGTDFCEHSIGAGSARALAAGDVDRDGDLDLLAAEDEGSLLLWLNNLGPGPDCGQPWCEVVLEDPMAGLDLVASLAMGDLDGDGDVDAVAGTAVQNELLWWENDIDSGAACGDDWCRHVLGAAYAVVGIELVDLDDDGDLDISVSDEADGASWWENDPSTLSCGLPWCIRTIDASYQGATSVSGDFDGDGDLDLVRTELSMNEIAWWPDVGGQFALPTSDAVEPGSFPEGSSDVLLLRIDGAHRGRIGDAAVEVSALEFLFEEAPGDPLTPGELGGLVSVLTLYGDDGDGIFEPGADDPVVGAANPDEVLTDGTLELVLLEGHPEAAFEVGAEPTWWLAADLEPTGGVAVPNRLRVTHLTSSSSTGDMVGTDIPLRLESTDDVASSYVYVDVDEDPYLATPIPDDFAAETVEYLRDVSTFFVDPEGGELTFEVERLPAGLVLSSSGLISGAAEPGTVGFYHIELTARDPFGGVASGSFDLQVIPATATIVVDGACTLRDAIRTANTKSNVGSCSGFGQVTTIVLDTDVTLSGPDTTYSSLLLGALAGLPDVTAEIVIEAGLGSVIERFSGFGCDQGTFIIDFRLLNLPAGGGPLTLRGLTLRNGCAVDAGVAGGGALYLGAAATLEDVSFESNRVFGLAGLGGAVAVDEFGVLTIESSDFEGNEAHGESGGIVGGAAHGGALWALGSVASLHDVRFVDNLAQGGDGTETGGECRGGALYLDAAASASNLSEITATGNQCLGGDGANTAGAAAGGAVATLRAVSAEGLVFVGNESTGGESTMGEGGAADGAFFVESATVSLQRGLFDNNTATGGAGGIEGGYGAGGGFASRVGDATLTGVTFRANTAQGGLGTDYGGSAVGGGLWGLGGSLGLRAVVVVDNRAIAGDGDDLAQALGGGLAVDSGSAEDLTIAGNLAQGAPSSGVDDVAGGGILAFGGGTYTVYNSLIGGNEISWPATTPTAADCGSFAGGSVASAGFNLVEAPATCTFAAISDQTGVDPMLTEAEDFGCVTELPGGGCVPTPRLLVGSPALDQGSCVSSSSVADVRGFERPFDFLDLSDADDGCDVGAFELRQDYDLDDDGIDDTIDRCLGDAANACFIFADDFESGGTTEWSAVVP